MAKPITALAAESLHLRVGDGFDVLALLEGDGTVSADTVERLANMAHERLLAIMNDLFATIERHG